MNTARSHAQSVMRTPDGPSVAAIAGAMKAWREETHSDLLADLENLRAENAKLKENLTASNQAVAALTIFHPPKDPTREQVEATALGRAEAALRLTINQIGCPCLERYSGFCSKCRAAKQAADDALAGQSTMNPDPSKMVEALDQCVGALYKYVVNDSDEPVCKELAEILHNAELAKEALAAQPATCKDGLQAQPAWIPVGPGAMPDGGKRLLVVLLRESGRRIRTVAQYVAPFTELADLDYADETQCDEKDGDLYVTEGWYEWPVEAEENYKLSGTVTHWQLMPELPTPPATEGGAL